MERKEYYLHLSSQDSKDLFPGNTASDFKVKIPSTLTLAGVWKCALTQISFVTDFAGERPKDIYICSDLIEDSYGSDSFMPILRKIPIPSSGLTKVVHVFPQNYYVTLSRDQLQNIHIYVRTQEMQQTSFNVEPLSCTLHLRRCE